MDKNIGRSWFSGNFPKYDVHETGIKFIHFIGVLCHAQEYFTDMTGASIMVDENWGKLIHICRFLADLHMSEEEADAWPWTWTQSNPIGEKNLC